MNDLQRMYQSGEIEPEEYIHALERRLAEAELNNQALTETLFDAILESEQTTPLLLRQAQLALQRSNELLEQRVAERTAALAESEMKYRALFENSLDMIFLTRTDGTIVDANPAACQALRMTREEVCSRGRAGIIQPDANLEKALKRRAAASRAQGELTFIRKDGSTFLAEVDSVIINLEWKDWTTFVTARDITERRQAEEALRDSEAKYRTLFESIDEGFCVIEVLFDETNQPVDYRFLEVNPAFVRQTGLHQAEGRRMRELAPLHEEYWFEIYGQIALSGAPTRFENKAEQLHRFYDVFAFRVGSPHERKVAVLFNDISERKRTEEAIQSHAIQLEDLNRALETTNQELAFANRELNDFAHIASHDLQEPLRKVSQFGNMLRRSTEPALAGEQNEYLERILDAAHRMQEMITGLLDYSRITTQGNPFSQVDLAQIAQEVLSDLEIRIQQTEGSVEVGDLPVIEADPLLMRQLFQNLIGNALKFHKPGVPPAVKVWAEGCQMEEKPGKFICLHVQDQGIGFDEKHLEKLFVPFMRLHGRSSYEGTGMGLSICRKIAERHGGTITANSSPGEGATFTVILKKHQHVEKEKD